MSLTAEKWQVWDQAANYGDTLYRRATGNLPEMESSKKMAKEIARVIRTGDSILDVGCGAGHYLPSLRARISEKFRYTGVDATEKYIELARKAFEGQRDVEFQVANIFQLDLPDNRFDIVMCNNVLLHLPSIVKPLEELVRVAKRTVLIRFLCGNRSFIIQDVHPQTDGEEFDREQRPVGFHFYNIYSQAYINQLLAEFPDVARWTITPDNDFDPEKIAQSAADHRSAHDASAICGGYQVNGYVLQPWAVLEITLQNR